MMHAPVVVGYLVGLAQFAGGLAILTGILFRVGAVCVAIVMLGAIFLVHLFWFTFRMASTLEKVAWNMR